MALPPRPTKGESIEISPSISSQTMTIANGASVSGSLQMYGQSVIRVVMPSGWTAAVITVQTSGDGSTWNDLYDRDGNEYTIQAAAGRSIIIAPADFAGMNYIRLRSGTSSAAVNQGAQRDIVLIVRPV